jgi:hypothetical protein
MRLVPESPAREAAGKGHIPIGYTAAGRKAFKAAGRSKKHYSTENLQMQHAVFNFLRAALIPELRADIAAGTAGNVQLCLIAVAAFRAFPY